jgi:8-oxo-dGTP pyrophosphatase MutT (NUDIX family)
MTQWQAEELVDWVEADGTVIAVVTRKEMRERRLRHRATSILVLNSRDEFVVHKRADWKEVYPGWWDVAFGGVVGAGEDWLESAERELAEEAGITGEPLELIGETSYEADDGALIGRAYLVRWDGEIVFSDGEVVEVDRVRLDQLESWLDGRLVCLDSRQCLVPLLKQLR